MVRGPAAVLAALGAALAYLLVAPALPAIDDARWAVAAAGAGGLVAVWLCGLLTAGAWREVPVLVLVAVGAALIGLPLSEADAPAFELVARALCAAALGALLLGLLPGPEALVALVLFLAGLDVWGAISSPVSVLEGERASALGDLAFALPGWDDGPGVEVGPVEVVMLGLVLAGTRRFGFRPVATAAAVLLALVVAVAVAAHEDGPFPATAAMAAGLLIPNLDLVVRLARGRPLAPRTGG